VDGSASRERIRAYVDRHRARFATPGLALGLTDASRYLGEVLDGDANVDARTPVASHHRFQIGSISKGFTALAILRLAEEGRLDLDAPVTDVLPWFEVRSRFAPITPHHLLSHSAGIVMGTDFTGDADSEVWSLRDTDAGTAPGERFRYSNVGYKALGLALEAITGEPWWETVRRRVMDPIGMAGDVVITDEVRSRQPVGYGSPFADRPWLPRHGFAPSPWFQSGTADGTISATAEELAVYARLLLAEGAPVVSAPGFERMRTPFSTDPQTGDAYGYGLKWIDGGRRLLGHTGGMVGFTSMLLIDVEAGVGVVALMNSVLGRRLDLVRFALACLAAEASGRPLPDVPTIPDDGPEDPAVYVGRYADESSSVEVVVERGGLRLLSEGRSAALVPAAASDVFLVDDPALDRFPVRFRREDGVVTTAFWGPAWLRSERHPGPIHGDHPEEWAAYPGRYASWNPWAPGFRIFLRGGRLWRAPTEELAEDEEPLEPLEDGSFRVGDASSSDRIRFELVVGGRATRAVYDAAPFYRSFTS
jgi:CubicO group peptidase (beta-lactamase class C family)